MAFNWLRKTKCTEKIKVFGWLLLSDRLNTRNMLKRKHYNIGTNLDCLLCGQHIEETVEYLFFHCSFSQSCWRILNITWSNHRHHLQLLERLKERHHHKMIMETFLLAAWSLWKERNNNHFRKIRPCIDSWKGRFINDFRDLLHRLPDHKKQLVHDTLATIQ